MARMMDEVLGHQSVKQRAAEARRQSRWPQALALVGPSGIGKEKLLWAMAQELLCERPATNGAACGVCGACVRVAKHEHEAILALAADGASIKVEATREVLRFLSFAHTEGLRLVLINDAHLLSAPAANALLKVLEEAPPASHFLLATSYPERLLPTVRSRLQMWRCSPLAKADLKKLGDFSEWILLSAQGRVDVAEQLAGGETQVSREYALAPWRDLLAGQMNVSSFWNWGQSGQKDWAEPMVRMWLQILRDARVVGAGGADLIHADQSELISKLAELGPERIDRLLGRALKLCEELQTNVDRTLALTSFWLESQTAVAPSRG